MIRSCHICVFCTVLLSFLGHGRDFPSYRFHAMPETSYYGGIHSIAKDSLGRLWFSGFDALYMWDGDAFVRMNDRISAQDPGNYWSFGHLVTDGRARLYVATNHGLFRFDGRHGRFDQALDGNIGAIDRTPDGTLWLIRNGRFTALRDTARTCPLPEGVDMDPMKLNLACSGEGVWAASGGRLFRLEDQAFRPFTDLETGSIVDVLESGGRIYVLTLSDGLYECGTDGGVLRRFTLPIENDRASTAKQLWRGADGIIWVATQYGLMLVDPDSGATKVLRTSLLHPFSLPNNSVWSIFPDGDGVWIGTYGGKLAYCTPDDSDVDFFKASPGGLGHPIVSCFEEDAEGRLWIGTEGGGITVWDCREDRFTYYTQQGGCGLQSNMVKKIRRDADGTMWVSFFNSGLQTFDARTGTFRRTRLTRGAADTPLSVYDFVRSGDALWLCDPDADVQVADLATGDLEKVTAEPGRRLAVETFLQDGSGLLWLVSHSGLYAVEPRSRAVVRTCRIDDGSYAADNLCCGLAASDGTLWLGTRGGGYNVLRRDGTYVNVPLGGCTVFGILEDPATGAIWLSTDDGLYRHVGGVTEKSLLNHPSRCGAFYVRSACRTAAGELLFGGTDGFIRFRPGTLRPAVSTPGVFFTDVRVNSNPLGTERYVGTQAPLRLSWRQSNLEIRFSSDQYLHPENVRYAYRLSGLSDAWSILPPGQRTVQYFDLPPGRYRFEVKADDGPVAGLPLMTIRPAPWASWWARLLYALLTLGLAWFIWRYFSNRHELEMEQVKERNMQELTRARINFFTNISHDLKTPLALVVDPLRQLKEHLDPDSQALKYAALVEKNVGRIQRMIGQLLTFREIESQKVTLYRQNGDLVGFLRSVFSLFEVYADRKGIEMDYHSDFDTYYTAFDHEIIEKIFTNLFSNAVKYTPDGGAITVRCRMALPEEAGEGEGPFLSVAVANTGAEIPKERQESIFEAFNRDREAHPSFETSTGLGLAIVKEMVYQMGARVRVDSAHGQVAFTVTFAAPPTDPGADPASGSYSFAEKEVDDLIEELEGSVSPERTARKSTTVVVIDDDRELRTYLEMHLSRRYNVYTAADGDEGIAKVEKVGPQVVVTDLMMRETDGFEVCRRLRGSLKSSHIPIIVLSGDSGNKARALESGANVFIEKPFEMEFLVSQVEALLRMQHELKEFYSKKFIAEPAKVTISSMDEQLLSRAMEHIERNIDNGSYDVDEFVSDMAVGRTILYQKIKDITGMSIKEFILDIRLKRAAQLLRESDLTVAEISDRTGFANPKYFSVCFKRRFDLTPTEFKKQA